MDISLNWLNTFVKVDDISAQQLAELITSAGIEVEGIKELAYGSNVVVGYVKSVKEHPDSDHLHVCQVEIEAGTINQIVCGAPNVAEGQKVIVALAGCVLSKDFIIKKTVIRGVESNGMICSLAELGIDSRFLSEQQKNGIEVLNADAPIGVNALEYLGLKDTILELGLTPNRADCLAISSFAYEAAAVLNRDIKLPNINYLGSKTGDIQVEIETELCSIFGVKLVKGLKTKESPQWLKSYLMASGVKPINNVVDISNFVMLETGQPIHMYDYDKLKSKKFVIKTGFDCEETLLDGESYKILPEDLIVSENDEIACIAGVMGSNSTKIDENTINIVIEAATFDGPTLRATARRLNLLTDASSRFIKNALNSAATADILERCANLLLELAEASEIYQSVIIANKTYDSRKIELKTDRVNKLLGTAVTDDDVASVFNKLHFNYEYNNATFIVTVPTYRNDITMEADLVEEVARIYGYDKIPSTLPIMRDRLAGYTNVQSKRYLMKQLLSNLGLNEAVTYSLSNPLLMNDFNYFHKNETISLLSPLGEERSVLRKSLIPSLLQVINYNEAHANKNIGIYEISNTYSNEKEVSLLSMACTGVYHQSKWQQVRKQYDFYVLKGFVETIFEILGIDSSRYQIKKVDASQNQLHPGRSCIIMMNKKVVGFIGQIHPVMEKKYDVKDVYVCELNLDELLNVRTNKVTYTALPQYPSVVRDLALVVDDSLETSLLVNVIKKSGGKIVQNIEVFDVYQGTNMEANKKSVALSITFLDETRTLEEKDIQVVMDNIQSSLEQQNAILRG